MTNTYLEIITDNPDICGSWNKNDVEAEMLDLEIPIMSDVDWIDYIIDRNFMDAEYTFPDALTECLKVFKDSYFKAALTLNDDNIQIELIHYN